MWFEAHLGVSASVEQEQSLLCGRVDMVVVRELCKWEEIIPVILLFTDEAAYILFQFLINLFGLSVGLWMIGR